MFQREEWSGVKQLLTVMLVGVTIYRLVSGIPQEKDYDRWYTISKIFLNNCQNFRKIRINLILNILTLYIVSDTNKKVPVI